MPNVTSLTDAQRNLVEEHLWLVNWALKKFRARVPAYVDLDDLEQAGRLGLITAALRFDAAQGNAFPTFAGARVVGAMKDYLRSLDGVSREWRHRITAGEEQDIAELSLDGFTSDPPSTAQSPEDAAMANQFTAQVRSLIQGLSGRTLAIVRSYYFEGKTMSTIGKEHGINESRVSHLHAHAMREIAASPAFQQRLPAFRFAMNAGLLRALAFLAIALAPAIAQPVSLRSTGCRSTSAVQITATVPVSVSATTVPVPICLDLGPGLKLNMAASPPRIELDTAALPPAPPAEAVVPRMVIKRVVLSAVVPDLPGITQMSAPLDFTPAPNTLIVAVLRSSRIGGDVVEFATPGTAQPKQVSVTLPAYRPFTTEDVLTFLYWTSEAP